MYWCRSTSTSTPTPEKHVCKSLFIIVCCEPVSEKKSNVLFYSWILEMRLHVVLDSRLKASLSCEYCWSSSSTLLTNLFWFSRFVCRRTLAKWFIFLPLSQRCPYAGHFRGSCARPHRLHLLSYSILLTESSS